MCPPTLVRSDEARAYVRAFSENELDRPQGELLIHYTPSLSLSLSPCHHVQAGRQVPTWCKSMFATSTCLICVLLASKGGWRDGWLDSTAVQLASSVMLYPVRITCWPGLSIVYYMPLSRLYLRRAGCLQIRRV